MSSSTPDVLPLQQCREPEEVGGKAFGLSELIRLGLPVPDGFSVTTSAYCRAVASSGLGPEIDEILKQAGDLTGDATASVEIAALFDRLSLDDDLAAAIDSSYTALGNNVLVAVRSSATAEDTADASFAGQQETYLGVRGAESVRRSVLRCWASLFTPHAIAYRRRMGTPHDALAMGVVVQRMVPASCAGVMMTLEPVTGDQSKVYVESVFGLGEGVVRGDVPVDRYWLDKHELAPVRQELDAKHTAYQMADDGSVSRTAIDGEVRRQPSLDAEQVIAVGALGRLVEERFGQAMDVEWAIDADGVLWLLQARPETVWSAVPEDDLAPTDWDPLHSRARPDQHFSRANIGEAIPGLQSPLSWSIWAPAIEGGMRRSLRRIGALSADEARVPASSADRYFRPFYGRPALQVEFLSLLGDRMPGTSGRATVKDMLGAVPDDLEFVPTRRRYPAVAWRFPVALRAAPQEVRRVAAQTEEWYLPAVDSAPDLSLSAARALLHDGRARFHEAIDAQIIITIAVIQPLFDALSRLIDAAGVGDVGVLSGSGGPEMEIVADLWRCAQGQISVEAVARLHGFHGPAEGLLDSKVWREDDAPIRRLLRMYEDWPDPRAHNETERLRSAQQEVLAALPRWQRPVAGILLRAAARNILLRGVCKRAFLQCFDVCRAATRRLGEHLVDEQRIDHVDEVRFVTVDELLAPDGIDLRDLIERRRARMARYETLELPDAWRGAPVPIPISAFDAHEDEVNVVTGTGVSRGVVEGVVRVVHDPSFTEVEPNEILVAPFTDPSWSSVLFVSAGLVVDIGGALSHAAVVAREMRIPCVVGTRDGTKRLRTGDRVRVDGTTGQIVLLDRAD